MSLPIPRREAIRPWREATPKQREIFDSPARFRVLVAGRRFGKTHLAINELVEAAQDGARRKVWYIAPTYRMAKEIAWPRLKEAVPTRFWECKNETDLSLTLSNSGSRIALRGADRPNRLRGVGLDFAVLDEAADMDPGLWFEVIRPALADRQGAAILIGTPRGFNWFYELFSEAAGNSPEWAAWQFTTLEGGIVPAEEIAAARNAMGARQFAQEFEARFEELALRVYSNFSRRETLQPVADSGGSVYIGMDFNVDPMTACVGTKAGDQLHIWDEIILPNGNSAEMAQEIARRFPGRDIRVYPDPSGRQRRTSAPVGETDLTILRRAGFRVIAPGRAPAVVDRINALQALLLSGDGQRRLFLHPRCRHCIRSLEGQTYKEGTSQPMKDGLDHMADALGYLVWSEFPIRAVKTGTGRTRGLL